jgi:hypothetical protein
MLPTPKMLTAITTATLSGQNYTCDSYLATTPIYAQNVNLTIAPPANQSAMTAFITSYTSQMSNFMITDTNGTVEISDEFQIYTQLCTPSTFETGTDVEFAVHGCVGLKKN